MNNDEVNEARYFNDQGKVLCQVCMKPFGVIGATHLKKHDMTMDQYKEQYPDAPLSSKAFKAKANLRDIKGFGSGDDETKPNPLMEDGEVSAKDVRQKAKEAEQKKEPEKEPEKLIPILQNKVDIIKFLKTIYPVVRENFFIEKRNHINDALEYSFITDIVDLQTKTIFDFPNAYWHNQDARQDYYKDKKLQDDGWTIHRFTNKHPSVDLIKEKLDLVF